MLWILVLALVGAFVVMAMWKRPIKVDREVAQSIAEAKAKMVAESQARQAQAAQQQPPHADPGAGSAV